MRKQINFIKARLQSFQYAFVGLRDVLKTEHNAWVHAFCTVLALLLSAWLQIDSIRFLLVIVAIALVWITEAINTVFEVVIDIVSPQYTESARRAKDIAAAAVLVAALAALVAGVVIFGPPLAEKVMGK